MTMSKKILKIMKEATVTEKKEKLSEVQNTEVQSKWDKAIKDPKKGPKMMAMMYKFLLDNDMLDK